MPSTVTARSLGQGAFQRLGIFQVNESFPADDAEYARTRLNQMMGSWAIQPLTIPVIAREVFPITADLGTYTIGPGGDFDTSRPSRLTGAALLLNNDETAASVTSISRSGSVATATVTSHGLSSGQNVTISGAAQAAYNGTFAITVTGVSTFTYVVEGQPTSPATGTITALAESTAEDVTEIPLGILTDDGWRGIQNKSLTSTLPTDVYLNPTFFGGFGTINLWPVPTTDEHALVLYRPQQLSTFPSLTAEYILPDGYEEALEDALAVKLGPAYGVALTEDVKEAARLSTGWMKRANVKLTDLAIDPMFTMNRRGGYNINTGTYTGGGRR